MSTELCLLCNWQVNYVHDLVEYGILESKVIFNSLTIHVQSDFWQSLIYMYFTSIYL